MKKILNIFCGLTLLAGVSSCDDYLDVNDDPNNPTLSQLTPNGVISAAQTDLASRFAITMNQLGNIMAATWSGNGQDFADPFGREFRFDITSTFYSGVWDGLYSRTNNLTFIENYEDGQNWDHHKAAAKILKAFYFQYIVDLYGDSPYTEIHQGTDNLFPSYDDDAATYRSLVTLIDEALDLIANTDTSTVLPFANVDTMMGGDMNQWIRFANTVKLRLLVRQIDLAQTDAAVNTYITNEFNDMQTEGAQFLTSNVVVNPGYINLDGKQNPFFGTYGFDVTGQMLDANRQVGPTTTAVNFLNGTSPNSVYDQRIERLWKTRNTNSNPCQETGTAITGITQGENARPSMLGTGVLCNSEQDLPLMLAAEGYLLQAEAMLRGYMPGNASATYETAIRSSFNYLGFPDNTAANAYIGNITGVNGLDINVDGMKAIMRQKWVTLTSINGIEIWIEMNRTDQLTSTDLPLPDEAVSATGERPVRLLYPASEYSGNSNNVIPQVTDDAFTSRVFWDVN